MCFDVAPNGSIILVVYNIAVFPSSQCICKVYCGEFAYLEWHMKLYMYTAILNFAGLSAKLTNVICCTFPMHVPLPLHWDVHGYCVVFDLFHTQCYGFSGFASFLVALLCSQLVVQCFHLFIWGFVVLPCSLSLMFQCCIPDMTNLYLPPWFPCGCVVGLVMVLKITSNLMMRTALLEKWIPPANAGVRWYSKTYGFDVWK